MIKYANQIIKEIEERGQIQVPNGYATGEEFEKWLRDRNINLTREEIVEDCEGILNMLNGEEQQLNLGFKVRLEKINMYEDDNYREPSVCDDCDRGDHWECMFCCSKCYEGYGECPNPDCDPMDI